MKPVNSNCYLILTIIEATYLKDADMFGKQDPLVKFKHQGREFSTTVKDDAGKHAVWNEKFELEDMKKSQNQNFTLVSYDEDTGGILEFLGETPKIPYSKHISPQPVKETVDLLTKKGKKAGTVTFSTEYKWKEPDPPLVPRQKDLNKKCKLHVKIIDATFLKDGDLMGKQDPYIKWKYGRGEF